MSFAIFLPVRNGGAHLKVCVNSILCQSYNNFKLYVLENASTDDTLNWLRSLKDERITVQESKEPLTIEENWARIVNVPTDSEYMTIVGHDDMLDKSYLKTMMNLIESYPDAGLYQAHFRIVDGNGKKIRSCMTMPKIEKIEEFLKARLLFRRDSFGTGYMFRVSHYRKLGGIPTYKKLMFSDDALWLQLMQDSYKATASTECFAYREHYASVSGSPDWQSTFSALDRYLQLLDDMAKKKKEISQVLAHHLNDYMMFWFQWAYLNTQNDVQKNAVGTEIWALVSKVKRILGKLNVSGLDHIDKKVRSHVFGRLSRIYWAYNRLITWIRRRT